MVDTNENALAVLTAADIDKAVDTVRLINESSGESVRMIVSDFLALAGSSFESTATFLEDGDTPDSYVGQALKVPRVNAAETALEFNMPFYEEHIALSDLTTALTVGTNKAYFRAPFAFTITAVRASVLTAPTGGTLLTIDINDSGTTILSTKLTFDASELTTTTAATPAVISDASIADDAVISFDIDAVGSTIAGAGLVVCIIGYRNT